MLNFITNEPESEMLTFTGYCGNPHCKAKNVFVVVGEEDAAMIRAAFKPPKGYNMTVPHATTLRLASLLHGAHHVIIKRTGFKLHVNDDKSVEISHIGGLRIFCHECRRGRKFFMGDDELENIIARIV